jgi:hypothetical protein
METEKKTTSFDREALVTMGILQMSDVFTAVDHPKMLIAQGNDSKALSLNSKCNLVDDRLVRQSSRCTEVCNFDLEQVFSRVICIIYQSQQQSNNKRYFYQLFPHFNLLRHNSLELAASFNLIFMLWTDDYEELKTRFKIKWFRQYANNKRTGICFVSILLYAVKRRYFAAPFRATYEFFGAKQMWQQRT